MAREIELGPGGVTGEHGLAIEIEEIGHQQEVNKMRPKNQVAGNVEATILGRELLVSEIPGNWG